MYEKPEIMGYDRPLLTSDDELQQAFTEVPPWYYAVFAATFAVFAA